MNSWVQIDLFLDMRDYSSYLDSTAKKGSKMPNLRPYPTPAKITFQRSSTGKITIRVISNGEEKRVTASVVSPSVVSEIEKVNARPKG